jgi:hypothetical protein
MRKNPMLTFLLIDFPIELGNFFHWVDIQNKTRR